MAYRVNASGVIETDSAQEAVELYRLLHAGAKAPAAPTKRKYRKRQAPPAKPGETDTVRTKRPELAIKHGVKVGQVWRKRWDKNKNYRTIQVKSIMAGGIMPLILKPGGTSKKSSAKFMGFSHMAENYVLVKDV
jgi:hypothetical protein